MFGLLGVYDENFLLKKQVLLPYTMFIYISRSAGTIILNVFLAKVSRMKPIEKIAFSNKKLIK